MPGVGIAAFLCVLMNICRELRELQDEKQFNILIHARWILLIMTAHKAPQIIFGTAYTPNSFLAQRPDGMENLAPKIFNPLTL